VLLASASRKAQRVTVENGTARLADGVTAESWPRSTLQLGYVRCGARCSSTPQMIGCPQGSKAPARLNIGVDCYCSKSVPSRKRAQPSRTGSGVRRIGPETSISLCLVVSQSEDSFPPAQPAKISVAARMHVDAMERCGYSVSVRCRMIIYCKAKARWVRNEGKEGQRRAGRARSNKVVSSQ
jgi:hypothetical protein